jgi:hypothetical protein
MRLCKALQKARWCLELKGILEQAVHALFAQWRASMMCWLALIDEYVEVLDQHLLSPEFIAGEVVRRRTWFIGMTQ